jgi:three-Cys-motif partner protein
MARDGLRARDNGEWGKEKLAFIEHFGPVALRATAGKRERHYLDLFAGPGTNKVRGTGEEFDGSPLLAIEMAAESMPDIHFTHAWCINKSRRDFAALEARLDQRVEAGRSRIPRERIHGIAGDANRELRGVLDQIHPKAYVLAFADMEAPKQCPWETIEALRAYRGHESVDLYILFPLDMALKRLLSSNPATVEQSASVLNGFYGDDRWRPLLELRKSGSDADRDELGRKALQLYMERLREKWHHVDVISDVKRGMHHKLYKMLYASDNVAGRKIAAWAKRRSPEQLGLL